MAGLDVYPLPGSQAGCLVDVQADLLSELNTRTVLPLLPEGATAKQVRELNRGVRDS